MLLCILWKSDIREKLKYLINHLMWLYMLHGPTADEVLGVHLLSDFSKICQKLKVSSSDEDATVHPSGLYKFHKEKTKTKNCKLQVNQNV